jgi:hypothetical protein
LRLVESGHELMKFAANPPPEGLLRFSPDGRSLLAQHRGGMFLWEVVSGQLRYSAPASYHLGFSLNGRLLFSLAERQIDVWDLTGEQTGGVLERVKHTAKAQAELWNDLQPNTAANKAYQAMWRLAADPEQTVRFLTEKVRAIEPVEPKETYPSPPEKILAHRIVELLEQMGTPEARRLLEMLATPAKPQFTDAARQALSRLSGK